MPKRHGRRPAFALLGPGVAVLAAIAGAGLAPGTARADTLDSSLVLAYTTNPQLNSQRAIVRQTDEGVPQALSGYRPKVAVTGTSYGGYSSWCAATRWRCRLTTTVLTRPRWRW